MQPTIPWKWLLLDYSEDGGSHSKMWDTHYQPTQCNFSGLHHHQLFCKNLKLKIKKPLRSKYFVIKSWRAQITMGTWLPHTATTLKLQSLTLCLEGIFSLKISELTPNFSVNNINDLTFRYMWRRTLHYVLWFSLKILVCEFPPWKQCFRFSKIVMCILIRKYVSFSTEHLC